jgi:ABC-type Fe3+-siderophore transport system permease subunit
MSFKTIFIITITVLVTIVLMKNTDEVNFWIFGDTYVSKLAILGVMFALGFIVGIMIARPRKKPVPVENVDEPTPGPKDNFSNLSDEDREYIS